VTVQHGQTVCGAGPYRWIRHPAYAGSIIQALAVPVLLGSLRALIPGAAAAVFMIVMTAWKIAHFKPRCPATGTTSERSDFA
jgi:protein-S-isoprenylcysteine O-methyltransferase Ste14